MPVHTSHEDQLLVDLRASIERLADAVAERRSLAGALRLLSDALPDPKRPRRSSMPARDPSAIRPLLWQALADGVIDYRRFDAAMMMRARAARILDGAHARRGAEGNAHVHG